MAIQQEQPVVQYGIPHVVCVNFVFRQIARTWQYRPEYCIGQFPAFNLLCRQNEDERPTPIDPTFPYEWSGSLKDMRGDPDKGDHNIVGSHGGCATWEMTVRTTTGGCRCECGGTVIGNDGI